MTTADDLLRRALDELEVHGEKTTWALIEEIRSYLDAPMKSMTEEEINEGFNPYRMRWLADDQYFVAGVRFVEQHHGIGGEE